MPELKSVFLTDRALLLLPARILVVPDLHVGLERELLQRGVSIPSQAPKLKQRLEKLLKQTRAKRLIILGDIKHTIPTLSWQELQELPHLLEELSKLVKIDIVKGNHDAGIETITPKEITIHEADGFSIDNFAFVHGHAWPAKELLDCNTIVMAHLHAAVEFWTSGVRAVEPCWLKCPIDAKRFEKHYKRKCNLKTAILCPSFHHLSGGAALNAEGFEPIGPLLKTGSIEWKEGEVYLLDGTYLGPLGKLKQKSSKLTSF